MLIIQIQVNATLEWNKVEVLFMQYWQHSVCCLPRCVALYEEETLFFISLWLQGVHLWSALSVFQDKLLEEMWKQQDSLEAPAATAAETPASPEAGRGSEENTKDSNPLLERLRALEVKWIAGSPPPTTAVSVCENVISFHLWNVRLIDREYHMFYLTKCISLAIREQLKGSTQALLFCLHDVWSLQVFVSSFFRKDCR